MNLGIIEKATRILSEQKHRSVSRLVIPKQIEALQHSFRSAGTLESQPTFCLTVST